jgi:hypothetical protein
MLNSLLMVNWQARVDTSAQGRIAQQLFAFE